MTVRGMIYRRLPNSFQPFIESVYYGLTGRRSEEDMHEEFVDEIFDSSEEYRRYIDEFDNGPMEEIKQEALKKYRRLAGDESFGAVSLTAARDYYALVRKRQPKVIVETGVCNGLSTLALLLAIEENDVGQLYSIDYPFRADEPLDEFRAKTFDEYGGAAIPSDKDPGWIIPNELRNQWTLIIGKSQRELPKLVDDLSTIDLFIHDSEHSHPCMMFEYELAYEWLSEDGIIISDDISWNNAFEIFVDVRKLTWGKASRNIGYAMDSKDN